MLSFDQLYQTGPVIAMIRNPIEIWQILSISKNAYLTGFDLPTGEFDLTPFINEADLEIATRKLGAGIMQKKERILMRYRLYGANGGLWVEDSCSLTYHPDGSLVNAGSLLWITSLPLEWHLMTKGAEAWNTLNAKLRHDMLNQLTAILGYLELSDDMIDDPLLKDFCDKEQQAAEKIREKLILTREYQKIGMSDGEWTSLPALFTETFTETGCNKNNFTTDIPNIKIFVDKIFKQAIIKILENIPDHAPDATTVEIAFSRKGNDGILSIEDNGKGIPDNLKTRIFDLGYGKKAGNGLFLAEKMLEIYGISIRESGVYGKSARFELTIPSEIIRYS